MAAPVGGGDFWLVRLPKKGRAGDVLWCQLCAQQVWDCKETSDAALAAYDGLHGAGGRGSTDHNCKAALITLWQCALPTSS